MTTPRIVLYATSSCPHCADARAALEACGEPFAERDPLSSPEILREMLVCSASAVVPTIVVSGRAMVGFDAECLEQMLHEEPLDLEPFDDYTEEELAGTDDDLTVERE